MKIWFGFLSLTLLIIIFSGCSPGLEAQDQQIIHSDQQVPELDPEMAIDGRTPLVSRQLITSRRNTGHGTNTRTDNVDYIELTSGNRPITQEIIKLDEIKDAAVYIQGRIILVGVYAEREWNDDVEKKVKETVNEHIATEAEVRVINDDEAFTEFQNQLHHLRSGAPYEEGIDSRNFLQDFGRILQRPFERGKVIN